MYLKYTLIATLIAILIFMGQVATYLIVDAVFKPDPYWLQRIAQTCNIDVNTDKQILNYKSLGQSGVPIFTYGAYLGLLLDSRFYS